MELQELVVPCSISSANFHIVYAVAAPLRSEFAAGDPAEGRPLPTMLLATDAIVVWPSFANEGDQRTSRVNTGDSDGHC